ncbi:MAG: hypothetical protein KIT80_15250 [Chitinophagaceae bacterium]|nr:hypothetical protein [Chitinophagaceae bacterium]MCW5928271.1 hypothetical protein [Chitinophagaceae bacterium]
MGNGMLFQESILEEIGGFLRSSKERVAVAESVTAGLLQLAFSQITDEDVSKINEGSENRLNDYLPPSGTRIKRGCIVLLRQPHHRVYTGRKNKVTGC